MNPVAAEFHPRVAAVRRRTTGNELNYKYRSDLYALRAANDKKKRAEHRKMSKKHEPFQFPPSRSKCLSDLEKDLTAIGRDMTSVALSYHNFGVLWHKLPHGVRTHGLLTTPVKDICDEAFVVHGNQNRPGIIHIFHTVQYIQKEAKDAVGRDDFEQGSRSKNKLKWLLLNAHNTVMVLRDCMEVLCRMKFICEMTGELTTMANAPQESRLTRKWERALPEICFDQEEDVFA